MTTLDGISSIEMVPAWSAPDVRPRIADCIARARVLRSSVAYWTVSPDFIDQRLADRLSDPDGFLCVDLHLPTDIDQLAALARRGASVRIYCEEIPTFSDDQRKEPPYLVHAKMLLFWMPDRTAELWIGSHNWTRRAIVGLNVECSFIVRMTDSSGLFFEAIEYLDKIKRLCNYFDPAQTGYYKELQRKQTEGTVAAIEIEATNADALAGTAITVFGTDPSELRQLGALRNVYVSAFDESGGGEHIYRATVMHSGLMPSHAAAAGGISFSARQYAFRLGSRFPKLLPISEVKPDVLRDAAYFVTLDTEQDEPNLQAFDPPLRNDPWQDVPRLSPLLERLDSEQLRAIFRGRPPVVRAPAGPTAVMPMPAEVALRRVLTGHRLVVRKLLRPRQ